MKDIVDYLKGFDSHTLIPLLVAFGMLYWNMNGQFKEVDQKIAALDTKLSNNISGLSERVNGLSERVARIEGILTHRDLCASVDIKDEKDH